jgi:hypothetical protein
MLDYDGQTFGGLVPDQVSLKTVAVHVLITF